jgi:SOS response regulatory protein OraA/RecX
VPRATALEQAAAALARRDRSAAALVAYLEERGVGEGEAAEAVERLRLAGYVDDGRLAALRAETLARRGHGDAAIRADLERLQVDSDAIESALASLEAEAGRARRVAESLGPTLATARKLARKGFSGDSIDAALAGLDRATQPVPGITRR